MKFSETIQEIIRLSDEIRQYWDRELPRRHPEYPLIRAGEDSGPPPKEEKELDTLLRTLPEEQIYTLIALMCLGIGDYSADYLLAEGDRLMRLTFEKPDLAISQMTGKPALGEYLRDGLSELAKRGIDVDSLSLARTTPTTCS